MNPNRQRREEIEPEIRPRFGVIQGGGESTDERGNLQSANDSQNQTSEKLADAERKLGVIQGGGESTDERGNLRSINDDEQTSPLRQGLYVPSESGSKPQEAAVLRGKRIAKKYGGVFGLISILGIGGGILATFFAPAGMLIHVMQNFTFTNDTTSTTMERRFLKVLNTMVSSETDPVCANTPSKKFKCTKTGRISNKALAALETKSGAKAVFSDDTKNIGKKTGYPSKNPTHYIIDMGDKTTKKVPAAELTSFLAENPKIARKVVGPTGAFKLGYKAWVGKHLANGFYKRFNLKRDGGLADGTNKKMTVAERFAEGRRKLQERTPDLESFDASEGGVEGRVNETVKKNIGRAKKAGAAYTVAAAGCIAVKAPSYIAAGVAGLQAAQVMAPAMDVVLSPASKAIASSEKDVDFERFNADDMDTIGTVLTTKTERESDGKMTSAMDSQYLLSAMGVNKGRVPVSEEFSPGYGVLSSEFVKKSREANAKSESACNAIMSPAAMYSAMALDSALTVAGSVTIVGGLAKVIIGLGVSKIAGYMAEKVVGNVATKALKEFAQNDAIPKAKGEKLGDVIGIGAMTFFSAGGMSRNLPVLKKTQLASYEKVHQENEAFNREMDIASLSPFDTSSRYTFLGSIAYNFRNAALMSGGYNIGSMLMSATHMPGMILSGTAGAATGMSDTYCSYADEFGLTTKDPKDTPAINAAGLPCTGITLEQSAMDTDTAINLMIQEGWIDPEAEVSDDATLSDLVEQEVIKPDTPLSDYMESCGHPETGDYLFNSATCTTNSSVAPSNAIAKKLGPDGCYKDEETGETKCIDENEKVEGVKNPKSVVAQAPFLIDYQLMQSINGEDDEPESSSGTTTDTAATSISVASYNMCQEINHPTCPSKDTKIEKIASVIEGSTDLTPAQIDIIGAQELSQPTQKGLLKTLSGYESTATVPENNGKAIFWNTSKFTKVNEDRLLGVNGNGDSNSVDNNSFPWVQLKTTSGQNVYAMSIHSPNDQFGTAQERYENVQKIREWSEKKSQDGSLVIITGDFNNGAKQDGSNPGAYCYMTENGTLQHARDMAGSKPTNSCPGDPVPIDQIYVSTNVQGMTASNWKHMSGDASAAYATDHSPAFVNLNANVVGSEIGSDEIRMPLTTKMWTLYSADFLEPHTYDSGTWTNGVRRLAADISRPEDGTPVYAMVGGTVSKADLGGHGLAIKSEIQGGTLEIAYAHGPRTDNKTSYTAGDHIMNIGALGNVTGGHLHVDMAFNGKGVCPQLVFKALGAGQTVDFAKLAQQSRAPC